MLKKLVKYGNSNALILDRAILELLNIREGAVVKLQTDGKSLIITPAEPGNDVHVSLSGIETLANLSQQKQEAAKADPVTRRLLEEWAPGTENFAKLMEAVAPISGKYMKDFHKLQSEAFLREVDGLAVKHHGDRSSEGFMEAYKVLCNQHVPNYACMLEELREAYKKAGYPAALASLN